MSNFLQQAGEKAFENEASSFLGGSGGNSGGNNLMNEAESFLGNSDNSGNSGNNGNNGNNNDFSNDSNSGNQGNQGNQGNSNSQQGGKYDQYISQGVDYVDSNVLHRNDSSDVKQKVSVSISKEMSSIQLSSL
jgi:hypothetical protein